MNEAGYRTPRRRVEGLGSAKAGTHDFWRQRLTAVALAPLSIWFIWSALHLVGADHATAAAFFAAPVNAVLMLLFLIAALVHMSKFCPSLTALRMPNGIEIR